MKNYLRTLKARFEESMKRHKGINPAGNALDIADAMSIELLTEEQYQAG